LVTRLPRSLPVTVPTEYSLPPLAMKRSIVYLPVNLLPFLAAPVSGTTWVSRAGLVCALAP
jgi:hypothetical protein